ncbi:MAG: hypothetical protein JST81_09540 [Bacteroidetes bacterium]|nr:hypothetical protein [Bacteroidota bacterium]
MKRIFLASMSALIVLSCSHKVSGSGASMNTKANDKPESDATSMYASAIKPIIEAKCTPCHFPDQGGNKESLNSYTAVSNNINEILLRVEKKPDERGFMPFRSKKEPLTAAEIASLKSFKAVLGK